MNEKIKKGRIEFDKKNFKKALGYFENVRRDDEDYDFAVLFMIPCLMNLKRYEDALKFLNYLIGRNPYSEALWADKASCHIILKQYEKAYDALGEIERIVDVEDKRMVLHVAKLYNWLRDDENALKYCDMALALDENYKKALHEKSLVAVRLKDYKMMNEIADRLMEVSDDDMLSLMPVLQLRLFSKNYRGCIDLIRSVKSDESLDDTIEMMKGGLYNKMCENFCARILVLEQIELSCDEAIDLMLDFHESGKDYGKIRGVEYFIL